MDLNQVSASLPWHAWRRLAALLALFGALMLAPGGPLQPSVAHAGVAPGPVGNLSATAGSGQATVSWTAPTTGDPAVSYNVIALSAGVTAQNQTTVPAAMTSYTMTGLAGGVAYKFEVFATNATGDSTITTTASTVTVTGEPYPYTEAVLRDSPTLYWRLDETAGHPEDSSGHQSVAAYVGTPTQGSGGLLATDTDTGLAFNGTSQYIYGKSSYVNPTTFSLEAWFKTTNGYATGGMIAAFQNTQNTTPGAADRHIYMANNGQIYFGVFNSTSSTPVTIHSAASYNDGLAHHVVAELSGAGMALYIDGSSVATDPNTVTQNYTGWWRAGQETMGTWANKPTSNYFKGTIDELAVYPTALSAQRVAAHYCAGSGVSCLSISPSTTVTFPAVTINGTDQTKTATATFDVIDNTDGDGWNLLATSTTFTTGSHQLPTTATTVASAPSSACDTSFTCTAPTRSVSYPYTLPAAASAPTATKLINAAVASGMGHQTITATFTLAVPGGAFAGSYASTWTFTLASGP